MHGFASQAGWLPDEPSAARVASQLTGERMRRLSNVYVPHRTDKRDTVSETIYTASGHGGRAATLAPDALLGTVCVIRVHATPRIFK